MEVLAPQRWPVRPDSLPPGTAVVGGAVRDALLGRLAAQPDLDPPLGQIPFNRVLNHRLLNRGVQDDSPGSRVESPIPHPQGIRVVCFLYSPFEFWKDLADLRHRSEWPLPGIRTDQ